MSLSAAVLLAATALFGVERPISSPDFGPAYGTQYPHALVSDGADFLAVWSGTEGVYAAVLDEHGVPRPTPPRALFEGFNPQAVWDGDAYVLAWSDGPRAYTARINRDAQLITSPRYVAHAVPMAIGASGGKTLLLIYRGQGIVGVLLNATGDVLRDDIELPTAIHPYAASIVDAGGEFVVVTVETSFSPQNYLPASVVRATRISTSGEVEGSVTLIDALPHNINSIDAATDGVRVGLAFVARRNVVNGPQRLYTFTGHAQTLVATAYAPRLVTGDDPQVVATPGGFASGLLDFANGSLTVETIPFATDDRHSIPLAANTAGADLLMATNGRTVMSVWRDFRFSPPSEYSTMNMFGIALDATASQPETGVQPVAISAVAQSRPSIASAGATSLVAWMDLTKTVQGNVVVRRVDDRGFPLDAEPRTLATDVVGHQRPVVAFTGDVWMVAWRVVTSANGDTRAFMRRIARDGAILDAQPIDLGPGSPTAAASNGEVTLLSFAKWLLRFSRAGDLLGTITLPEAAWGHALGCNGSEFLLAWDEGSDWWQFPSPNMRDVRAIRLDASGSVLDTVPIDIAMSAWNEHSPVVAANGADFLVMYQHSTNGVPSLRAKRVLRTGVLGDHTKLDDGNRVGLGEQSYSIASRGDGYIAVFAMVLGYAHGSINLVPLDVRGVATAQPVTLATTKWTEWPAWTSITSTMIAYSRSEPSLDQIERTFVRALDVAPRRRTIRR